MTGKYQAIENKYLLGDKKKPQQMSLKDMFAKQNKRKAEDEAKGIIKKPKVRILFLILSSCCHI